MIMKKIMFMRIKILLRQFFHLEIVKMMMIKIKKYLN